MFETVKWSGQAAEQNYAPAQFNLGYCYANGQGVRKDKVEAAEWYRKAAEQNYTPAQSNLGWCSTMAGAWRRIMLRR